MRILIAGYYGFGNLGDELILSSILSQLRGRYSNPEVTVLSANPSETETYHRIHAVSRWNVFSVLAALWRHDFLILGGGGLLQNKTSDRSLIYYLSLIAFARVMQCPVVLFAMGVESIEGSFLRSVTRFLLNGSDVKITVRDEVSKQILVEIGVPAPSIHITADPVFTHASSGVRRERYGFQGASALLIPRFPCPASGRRLFAIAGRILREEKKMKVSGLLFQPQAELPHLQKFNGEMILSDQDFLTGFSLDETAAEVGKYDWILSARFHGLVLAALAGRPFIGVGDPNKVGRLCRTMKMPFLKWDASEEEIKAAIEKIALKSVDARTVFVEQLGISALQTADYLR
jgi:polysaccharide pyruvyl transferase CsaB